MGKSIDEIIDCFMRLKYAIEEGENVDSTKYDVYPVTISFEKEHCMEIKEVVYSAIDTMHKYQKIIGIVSLNDEEFKQCGLKELKEILEVIADGNDD